MPVILNVSLLLFTAFVHLTLSISSPEVTWLTIFTVQPEVRGSSLPRLNLSSLCWETSLGKDAHVGKDLGSCIQRFPTRGRAKANWFLDFTLFYFHLQICGWPQHPTHSKSLSLKVILPFSHTVHPFHPQILLALNKFYSPNPSTCQYFPSHHSGPNHHHL